MNNRWLFAAGMIYKDCVKEFIVLNICVDAYVSGYVNAIGDVSANTKKPFLHNIANMAVSTCSGFVKGALFPIYLPSLAAQLAYNEFQRRR